MNKIEEIKANCPDSRHGTIRETHFRAIQECPACHNKWMEKRGSTDGFVPITHPVASKIEEIKAKLEAHRNDLSILTAEERNILSADGVAKMRGPLAVAAAKVRQIGHTNTMMQGRIEQVEAMNRQRVSRGYTAIQAHDIVCDSADDGLEERLTCLLANLMHVCQSTGQPEIFMRALHMANTHFAAEINQD